MVQLWGLMMVQLFDVTLEKLKDKMMVQL